jgi:hypothetical protein
MGRGDEVDTSNSSDQKSAQQKASLADQFGQEDDPLAKMQVEEVNERKLHGI